VFIRTAIGIGKLHVGLAADIRLSTCSKLLNPEDVSEAVWPLVLRKLRNETNQSPAQLAAWLSSLAVTSNRSLFWQHSQIYQGQHCPTPVSTIFQLFRSKRGM
jgi:hypothetical protein